MTNKQGFDRHILRSLYLAERNVLSSTDRTALSRKIVEKLVQLPVFTGSTHLFIYCSYQSEVDTLMLLHQCLRAKKSVSVPLVVPQHSKLLAVTIKDPTTDLSPGYKGIPEPMPFLAARQTVRPRSIEIVIVPGVVFDRSGHRLGYGGGYYDRFLAQKAPQAYRIGLAFSMQLVDHIPVLSHDIPMDMLVTENEVLNWSRS